MFNGGAVRASQRHQSKIKSTSAVLLDSSQCYRVVISIQMAASSMMQDA